MMDRYGSSYEQSVPLSYDPAIYWVDNAHYAQIDKSIELRDDPHAERYCQETLDQFVAHEVAQAGWGRYHSEETRETEGMYTHIRRTIYECPFFREIKRYRGPPGQPNLRIFSDAHTIADLPLRRLIAHDRPALGALYEDTLYIVEIVLHTDYSRT